VGDNMLQNMENMLKKAYNEKYAVPQFNINNLEWTRFILEECEQLRTPVILGVSEGAVKYKGGYKTVVDIAKGLIEHLEITIPVAIHLDHGTSYESCRDAIKAGFTSVMIDASTHPIEENVRITKSVVDYDKNVTVEAEVGAVGGEEDGIEKELAYAELEDAIKMVNESGVHFLAPALGSVHGPYKGEPKLDFIRMAKINNELNIPLVLHGASGIGDNLIKEAISNGVAKININTELQIAWSNAVREFLLENPNVYDPRKVIKSGEEALKKIVRDKVTLFGSAGEA